MGNISQKISSKYYGFLFHYYRAEVYRETNWRNRMDITTNWSIVVTAAILSFAFSNPGVSHMVILINYLAVWYFLYIESRRFRYYSLVRERAKIYEKHILGPLLSVKEDDFDQNKWLEDLSEKLRHPKVTMSRIESVSWRLRRNYFFMLALLFIFWVYKVHVFSQERTFWGFLESSSMGFVPGWIVTLVMILSLIFAFGIAYYLPRIYGHDDLP